MGLNGKIDELISFIACFSTYWSRCWVQLHLKELLAKFTHVKEGKYSVWLPFSFGLIT